MTRKIKIVISGLLYPVTMLHYFWRAFERREDVDLVVAGPYFGNWIPWRNGMYLPERYVKVPQIPLPPNVPTEINSSIVESKLPWMPDLWIQIDAGWHFNNRPNAGTVVHIQTDPHVLKDQYRKVKSLHDLNFCMQGPYIEDREFYLPYAFDPTVHYPEDTELRYDACLIGLQYERRMQLVSALRQRGINVFCETGIVYDEYRQVYNQSRVALSWSSLLDTPTRVFEAMGMGVPLVCNRTPDLSNYFVDGDHYLGFDDVQEAVSKVEMLLNNESTAQRISDQAYRKVISGHRWDDRVATILDYCKLA